MSLSPLTCGRSRRHGRRRLPVGCVRLVAIPQTVSGPRRPLFMPSRRVLRRFTDAQLSQYGALSLSFSAESIASHLCPIPPARPPSSPGRLCPPCRHLTVRKWFSLKPARARGPSAPRVRTPCTSRDAATSSQNRPDRAPLLALRVSSLMPNPTSAWRALVLVLVLTSDVRPIPPALAVAASASSHPTASE